MCGIGGFSRADGASSIPDARIMMRELSYALVSRGKDAVGFGWVEEGWPRYWTHWGSANAWSRDCPLPQGMRLGMVHDRKATKGSPHVEANNHPVQAPGIILTHNGRVDNDQALLDTVGATRAAEVDSEALAWLLSAGPKALGTSDPAALLELVEGVAALAWIDGDEPTVLHLARCSTRPLEVAWTRRGDLVYASTRSALDRAANACRLRLHGHRTIREGTYLRVESGRIVREATFKVTHPPKPVPEDLAAGYRHFPREYVWTPEEMLALEECEWEESAGWRDRMAKAEAAERQARERARAFGEGRQAVKADSLPLSTERLGTGRRARRKGRLITSTKPDLDAERLAALEGMEDQDLHALVTDWSQGRRTKFDTRKGWH